jgi:precorrin-2 dehydrogenase
MPDYFPAFLDLRDRRCLVVGGGPVGERKAHELLSCGARVLVVSRRVTPELRRLSEAGTIALRERPFITSDVQGRVLVIAATGVDAVDAAVAAQARRQRALVNVVDRPGQCGFICPSVLRRGQLQIAVSTGARSPTLAREIRRRLEGMFDSEWAELVEAVGEARKRLRAVATTPARRMIAGARAVGPGLTRRLERALRPPLRAGGQKARAGQSAVTGPGAAASAPRPRRGPRRRPSGSRSLGLATRAVPGQPSRFKETSQWIM